MSVLNEGDRRFACPVFQDARFEALDRAKGKMGPISGTEMARKALGNGRACCEICSAGLEVTIRAPRQTLVDPKSRKFKDVYRLSEAKYTVRVNDRSPECLYSNKPVSPTTS